MSKDRSNIDPACYHHICSVASLSLLNIPISRWTNKDAKSPCYQIVADKKPFKSQLRDELFLIQRSCRAGMMRLVPRTYYHQTLRQTDASQGKAIVALSRRKKLLSHPRLKLMTFQQLIRRKQLVSYWLVFKKYASVIGQKARHLIGC